MSDRPPHLRPVPPLSGAYASAEDAVFEDLSLPGDGAPTPAPPAWDTFPVAPPEAPSIQAPAPEPAPPVVEQLGDPFREGGDGAPDALGYDPDDGFRIDFDEEPTAALVPVTRPLPAPRPGGPPAPPPIAPPR